MTKSGQQIADDTAVRIPQLLVVIRLEMSMTLIRPLVTVRGKMTKFAKDWK